MNVKSPSEPVRIALVGASGFGATHLANLARLGSLVELVGVADPVPPRPGAFGREVPAHASLEALLEAVEPPDIVIVSTPIHTHEQLALLALEAGADVYLEKPTVPSFAGFERLVEAQRTTGGLVQVGFQSLGSHALAALANDELGLGPIVSVSATGLWMRDRSYWTRSSWAGRRLLDGRDVVDGVVTNPLAHAVATALRIAGSREAHSVHGIDVDLYRANEIEADDTSVVRASSSAGIPVTAALTLCAERSTDPRILLQGTESSATFWYTKDLVELADGSVRRFGRTDLLENLIAQRRTSAAPPALLSPLESTGAFMRIVEAVRVAEPPRPVDDRYIDWRGHDGSRHPVIDDIDHWVRRAAREHATFSELGAPWARAAALDPPLTPRIPLIPIVEGREPLWQD